jgi:hypothetical protein
MLGTLYLLDARIDKLDYCCDLVRLLRILRSLAIDKRSPKPLRTLAKPIEGSSTILIG